MPRGQPGTKAPHGTLTRYNRHGCRCAQCRTAMREWQREKYGHVPWDEYLAAIEPEHGTESRYTGHGCRCDACTEAANEARAKRREAPNVKQHGASGYSNGCRCDTCRIGHRVYRRDQTKRQSSLQTATKERG